jgi:hypothetical protein
VVRPHGRFVVSSRVGRSPRRHEGPFGPAMQRAPEHAPHCARAGTGCESHGNVVVAVSLLNPARVGVTAFAEPLIEQPRDVDQDCHRRCERLVDDLSELERELIARVSRAGHVETITTSNRVRAHAEIRRAR